nr:MAG TPA: hypothetical protein [Crassvirales sp.]
MESCNDKFIDDRLTSEVRKRQIVLAENTASLASLGFLSKGNSENVLSFTSILIDAYENLELFSKSQKDNLNLIYNKILKI